MSCKIQNTTAWREFISGDSTLVIEPAYFSSKAFLKDFGDWENLKVTDVKRVNLDGSPKIFLNYTKSRAYYINKSNKKKFINHIKFHTLTDDRKSTIKNDITDVIVAEIYQELREADKDFNSLTKRKDKVDDKEHRIIDSSITIGEYFDKISKELIEEHEATDNMSSAVIESIKASRGDYIIEIKKRLANIGISYREEKTIQEDLDEKEESGGAVVQMSAIYRKPTDKTTFAIKSMLTFIPMLDNNNEPVFSEAFPNRPMMMNPSKAWGILLRELVNIPMEINSNVEIYLDALNRISNKYPWVNIIHSNIENGTIQEKIAFVTAFNNIKQTIYTFTNTNGELTVQNTSESGNNKRYILKDWVMYSSNTLFFKDDIIPSKKLQLKGIRKMVANSLESIKKDKSSTNKEKLDNIYKAVFPILDFLEIDANKQTFNIAFYDNNDKLEITSKTPLNTSEEIAFFLKKIKNTFVGNNSIFDDLDVKLNFKENIITKLDYLAKAHLYTEDLAAGHSATVGDKRIYLYSLPTVIQELLNQFKANPGSVKKVMANNKHLENSLFLKAMLKAEILNKTNIGLRGVLQNKEESDKAKNAKDIGIGDYIKTDIFAVLNRTEGNHTPLYETQVPSDKGRNPLLSLHEFQQYNSVQEAIPTFYNYLKDELQEMLKAKQEIEDAIIKARKVLKQPKDYTEELLNLAAQDLVVGYHLGKGHKIADLLLNPETGKLEISKYLGNAFNFKLFESLEKPAELFNPVTNELVPTTPREIEVALDMVKGPIREHIEIALNDRIENFKNFLKDKSINIVTGNNNKFDFQKSNIDSSILKDYAKEYLAKGGVESAREAIYREYVLNSIISKIEFSKLWTGPIQYFTKGGSISTNANYIKRNPFAHIDGLQPVIGITEDDAHFTQMTFETESFQSELFTSPALSTNAKSYYKSVDRTDAQAWITPKRWHFLMERTGKLTPAHIRVYEKMQKQWDMLSKGDTDIPKLTSEDVKVLSTQSLKGVYGKNEFSGHPIYLKYSQAVLTPELVLAFPKAKALFEHMEKFGIDEAVADTGVKVGALKPVSLKDNYIKKDGKLFLDIEGKYTPQILDNRNWRLQQELPTKGIHLNKIGVQLQKIIIDGLAFIGDNIGTLEGIDYNGPQLAEEIEKALGDLSDIGLRELKSRFGITGNTLKIKDMSAFYSPMIRELEKDGKDIEDIVGVMKEGYSPASIPTYEKRIIAAFLSTAKKASTHLLTKGGSLIQISDHLIGKEELKNKGVTMLVNFDRLKPPRLVISGEADQKTIIIPGQVLIPHAMIVDLLPDYDKMSIEELNKALPKEVKEMIGYRIPTQARASVDFIEVVGILPKGSGDSIIAYGEITSKTGSDFDIDKMFFILPDLDIVRAPSKLEEDGTTSLGHINRLKLSTEGKSGVRNRVFKLFRTVLKSPLLYEKMMTSIDNDLTQVSIESTLKENSSYDLQVFGPVSSITTRFNLKAGVAGIGEMANANSSHIISQGKGITSELNLGTWGNSIMDAETSETLTSEEMYGNEKYKGVIDYILDKEEEEKRSSRKRQLISELSSRPISSINSELINAFLDIANKNSFITKGNWGSLLNNYGTLLIRNGVHPSKVFALFQQPIISKLVNQVSSQEGIIDNTSSFQIRKELLKRAIAELYAKYPETNKEGPDKVTIPENNKVKLSNLSLLRLLDSAKNGATSKSALMDQILVLKHLMATVNITRIYANGVLGAKVGEKGVGRSMGEFFTTLNALSNSFSSDGKLTFNNLIRRFFDEEGKSTLLMKFYENTGQFLKGLIQNNPDLFYGYNDEVRSMFNEIMTDNSRSKYVQTPDIANTLLEHSKAYLLSGFKALNTTYSQEDREKLIKELFKLKLDNNYEILNKLHIENGILSSILIINKISTFETKDIEALISSWSRLIKEHPVLGKFLVHDAYSRSAFKQGPRNFGQVIPPRFLLEEGIDEYVTEDSTLDSEFKEQFARNRGVGDVINKIVNTADSEDTEGIREVRVIAGDNNLYHTIKEGDISKIPKFASNPLGEFLKLIGFNFYTYINNKVPVEKAIAVYTVAKRVPHDTIYYNSNHEDFMEHIDPEGEETSWDQYKINHKGEKIEKLSEYEYRYRQQDLQDVDIHILQENLLNEIEAKKERLVTEEEENNENCEI